MPVMTQISDASDKIFDAVESTNERAHEATKNIVTRIQDTDLPFADRFAKVEVPFMDRLPEPIKAVDAYFDFVSTGIETNRNIAEKLVNRFTDTAEVVEVKAADVAKKAPAKKATAKKSTAKKA